MCSMCKASAIKSVIEYGNAYNRILFLKCCFEIDVEISILVFLYCIDIHFIMLSEGRYIDGVARISSRNVYNMIIKKEHFHNKF